MSYRLKRDHQEISGTSGCYQSCAHASPREKWHGESGWISYAYFQNYVRSNEIATLFCSTLNFSVKFATLPRHRMLFEWVGVLQNASNVARLHQSPKHRQNQDGVPDCFPHKRVTPGCKTLGSCAYTCKSRRRSISTCFSFFPPPLTTCGGAVLSPPGGPDAPLRCCLGRGALERNQKASALSWLPCL